MNKIKKIVSSIIVSIILYISILMLMINTIYNDNNTEWLESTTPFQHGIIFSVYTIFFTKFSSCLVALTESLKNDLEQINSKIKAFCLCPGFVATKITESERNRPLQLQDEIKTNPVLDDAMKLYHLIIGGGVSPIVVAKKIFQCLRGDQFYVISDNKEFITERVNERMNTILKDIHNA